MTLGQGSHGAGIGRLKQKYPRAAQYYEISVEQDETGPNAKAIHWQRITPVDDTLPGVYCQRTMRAPSLPEPTV